VTDLGTSKSANNDTVTGSCSHVKLSIFFRIISTSIGLDSNVTDTAWNYCSFLAPVPFVD